MLHTLSHYPHLLMYMYMPDSPTDLTAPQVTRLLNFLIENICIQVGSSVFQQAIGIPMATDCAPLIADLFLFSAELDSMKKLVRTDFSVARKIDKTFRYIDDLLTLNNCQFEKAIPNIYPKELELKRTTKGPKHCSYLDLIFQNRKGVIYKSLRIIIYHVAFRNYALIRFCNKKRTHAVRQYKPIHTDICICTE